MYCITEAWINEKHLRDSLDKYKLDGLKFFAYQRENNKGEGIAVYIKENLNSIEINKAKICGSI